MDLPVPESTIVDRKVYKGTLFEDRIFLSGKSRGFLKEWMDLTQNPTKKGTKRTYLKDLQKAHTDTILAIRRHDLPARQAVLDLQYISYNPSPAIVEFLLDLSR